MEDAICDLHFRRYIVLAISPNHGRDAIVGVSYVITKCDDISQTDFFVI